VNKFKLDKSYVNSYILINIPATPLPLACATMAGFLLYGGGSAVQ